MNNSKKFELALETEKTFFGIKMFRIRALISFSYITKGDLGGYIEKESNLNQSGNAWVSGDAQVFGNAQVSDDAWVSGNAQVFGNARVSGNARVQKFHQCSNITNLNWLFTSLPKGVQIGCYFYSMKEWKEKYLEIGKKEGLTEDQCHAYYNLMKAIRKVQHLQSKRSK